MSLGKPSIIGPYIDLISCGNATPLDWRYVSTPGSRMICGGNDDKDIGVEFSIPTINPYKFIHSYGLYKAFILKNIPKNFLLGDF
jgi:hypothetical protein